MSNMGLFLQSIGINSSNAVVNKDKINMRRTNNRTIKLTETQKNRVRNIYRVDHAIYALVCKSKQPVFMRPFTSNSVHLLQSTEDVMEIIRISLTILTINCK